MSASVQANDLSSWRRAVAHLVGRRWFRLWRIGANKAFPAWSFADGLSQEEFASYLLLIAAHI